MKSTIRIVSLVEATTMNAVAKLALEFFRTARELVKDPDDPPPVEGSVITFDRHRDNTKSPNEFVAGTRAAGIPIDIILERHRFDLKVITSLEQIIEQRRPDLVITNSVKSHFLLWRSQLWKKYPWVAFHHGYTTTDRKMRVYNRLDRWSLPKADLVLTVCEAFAGELAATANVPREKIAVQHNATRPQPKPSPAEVQTLKDRFGIGAGEQVILAVGRLSREKAHVDLVSAFKHLCQTNPANNYKLLIVGDGAERERLESAAQASGFAKRIIFAGQMNDVQPFYAMADVFVLPSHSEGSPNALLEAMAAKVPIVATAVGGVPEIVANNESALMVSATDPTAMAAAILRMLTDRDLAQRLTAMASELVTRQYSPEEYVRSLVKLYRQVIDQRRSIS